VTFSTSSTDSVHPLVDPERIRAAIADYADGKKNYHVHELPPLAEDSPKTRRAPRSRRHAKGLV